MNLLTCIPILPQLLQWASSNQIPSLYRAVILSSLIVWVVILLVVLMFTLRVCWPSGIDALGWRCLCTSLRIASSDFCLSFSSVARCISTSFTDLDVLQPLLNCQLIALAKNPRVWPIGIGETSRKIIAKAVLHVSNRMSRIPVVVSSCVQDNVLFVKQLFMLCGRSLQMRAPKVFCYLMLLMHSTPAIIVQPS